MPSKANKNVKQPYRITLPCEVGKQSHGALGQLGTGMYIVKVNILQNESEAHHFEVHKLLQSLKATLIKIVQDELFFKCYTVLSFLPLTFKHKQQSSHVSWSENRFVCEIGVTSLNFH